MCSNSTTVLLKKRERTQNWIPEEKNALFSLIKGHVSAIENKKIDAAASAMKMLAWQQIHRAFRGIFSTDRDITRMREQWRRMKSQARMEMYTFAEKVNQFLLHRLDRVYIKQFVIDQIDRLRVNKSRIYIRQLRLTTKVDYQLIFDESYCLNIYMYICIWRVMEEQRSKI